MTTMIHITNNLQVFTSNFNNLLVQTINNSYQVSTQQTYISVCTENF